MSEIRKIQSLDLANKKVFLRLDLNVPIKNGVIQDDTRIQEALPTLKYILEHGAKKIVLMSHLGRPDGKVVAKYSLKPVAARLKELLSEDVLFLNDCAGDNIKQDIDKSKEKVILLENLRFHAEEEANDANFSKQLAFLADIFIKDFNL